jgi:hypothetical protein
MHIGLGLWMVFAIFRWGDWSRFRQYYPTMLYVSVCKVLYEFVAHQTFYLWKLHADFGPSYFGVIMIHAFFLYPFSAFLFLSNYPKELNKQIVHYLKWIFIYTALEWLGYNYGTITYSHGWNFWWSIIFTMNMFALIRIHFVNYLWAIPLTAFTVLFYMYEFNM